MKKRDVTFAGCINFLSAWCLPCYERNCSLQRHPDISQTPSTTRCGSSRSHPVDLQFLSFWFVGVTVDTGQTRKKTWSRKGKRGNIHRMTCNIRMNRKHEPGPFFGQVARMISSFITRAPNAKRFCGFQARPLFFRVRSESPFEFQ